ncbi:alpha/beta hydrolase-fold protein [Petroclostridium sp. X23]|uniref:alpha/beta hydrolase n=1 Tax=Petroclostridium sp. X23 TaxID=3045146 RepID=UPI0024ACB325|nr:alpha/beta hydrolase-fold protein [Petroclostridium sp. X23]WHH59085.1 alpha/beta hydrolase-fold protein [Petroclostridium sp. X23]
MNIDVFNTKLTPFDRDVIFRVMTPDSYEVSHKRYPVLYMNDGQDIFYDDDACDGESLKFAQYYKEFGKFLPEIILVGIDCPSDNVVRTAQYTPYYKTFDVQGKNFEPEINGTGKEYLEWLVNELKPWIDASYRTRPECEMTGIYGSSTAGVVSTYALMKYPEVFSRLIALSSAYYIWFDCLKKTIEESTFDHVNYIYLDAGTKERGRMTEEEQFIKGNEMMHQKFMDLGFDEKQMKFAIWENDTHTHHCFARRFPDALRWVFQDT